MFSIIVANAAMASAVLQSSHLAALPVRAPAAAPVTGTAPVAALPVRAQLPLHVLQTFALKDWSCRGNAPGEDGQLARGPRTWRGRRGCLPRHDAPPERGNAKLWSVCSTKTSYCEEKKWAMRKRGRKMGPRGNAGEKWATRKRARKT